MVIDFEIKYNCASYFSIEFRNDDILSLAIPVSDALILNQLLLIGIVGIYYNFTVYSKSS